MPIGAAEAAGEPEERYTFTRGDAGFEVKMKEGKRAIWCSVHGGGGSMPASLFGAASAERSDGDGEGGSGISASDRALPFDLHVSMRV